MPLELVALLVSATTLWLVLAQLLDLGIDEAYVVAVGWPFQLSYFDHPPLTYWIGGGLRVLLGAGVSPLVLRLPFIAMSVIAAVVLYFLTWRHFGRAPAAGAVLLFILIPFMFLSSGWIVPDAPLRLALLVAALCLSGIVLDEGDTHGHWGAWLGAGLALGFGLLSKYHAGLFALGAVGLFATTPALQPWFRRPQPYIAAGLALLLFTPVLLWNAGNGWVSFGYQVGRAAPMGEVGPVRVLIHLALEFAYLLPTLALVLLASPWATRGAGPRANLSGRFFLFLGLPIVLLFNLLPLFGQETFPHWPFPGWLLLLPMGGLLLTRLEGRWRHWPGLLLGASGALFAAAMLAIVVIQGPVHPFGVVPQLEVLRVEATSWRPIALDLARDGAFEETATLVAGSWLEGARVADAFGFTEPVRVFGDNPKGFAWLPGAGGSVGQDALVFTRAGETGAVLGRLAPLFEEVRAIGTYPISPGSTEAIVVSRAIGQRAPYRLPYGAR